VGKEVKDKYSHRDRIEMILAGERPDRYAASFWRHFFHKENNAEGTAQAMLDFQRQFDWDFMKINPRADYHIEDWGLKQIWSRDEFKKHTKTAFPVNSPDDWQRIQALPLTSPALAEHLKVVSLIRKGSSKELPLLMTVFTPISIAGRMVKDHQLLVDHLHRHPEKVHAALRGITETFKHFVVELRNAGADGIFYATTHWASTDLLTWEEYQEFGIPYDLEVIQATETDSLNLLHVCAGNNYLRQLSALDYRSKLVNWDASDPTNVPLDRADEFLSGKTLVGGVDYRGWLIHSRPDEIVTLIDELKRKHDSAQLIIGPGCSIEPTTPMDNLKAIRERLV
jgi:uroporphyrinogen decarboxylase